MRRALQVDVIEGVELIKITDFGNFEAAVSTLHPIACVSAVWIAAVRVLTSGAAVITRRSFERQPPALEPAHKGRNNQLHGPHPPCGCRHASSR